MYKPLFSLAIILLSVVFGFMYVKPQYERAQSQRAAIISLDETLGIVGEIETKIENTKKELESISRVDSERFAVFLPEKIDTIRFANDLQRIGKTHRLILADIKIEDPTLSMVAATSTGAQATKGSVESTFSLDREAQRNDLGGTPQSAVSKKYRTSKASFSVSTSYGDFFNLLADIERSLGLINITSLSFRPADETNSETNNASSEQLYQYAVELETYSLN